MLFEFPSPPKQDLDQIGPLHTDPNRKGDIAEQYVALLATWKGAEVLRNTGCTGAIDMILVINGIMYPIDVKLARPTQYPSSWRGNTDKVEDPVIPVLVIPCGDIMEWKVKWIHRRYPIELKDFWNKPHATKQIQDTDDETVRQQG